MAIDPSIPLQTQSPNIFGAMLGSMQTIQQGQAQRANQQLQERRIALDEQQESRMQWTAELEQERLQRIDLADAVARAALAPFSVPTEQQQVTWEQGLAELKGKGVDISQLPPQWNPGFGKTAAMRAMSVKDQLAALEQPAAKTRSVKTRNPDGSETEQIVEDVPGQTFTSAPEAPKVTYGAPQTMLVNGRRTAVRPGSDGRMYDMNLKPIGADAIAPEAEKPASPGSFEQQIADALARGDQATVDRLTKAAELASGARARTQGRPVSSGDANRIADFDTSLDDVDVLSDAVSGNKATGTIAKAGAMLPNWVTEITGWGADAKSKQAVIDRVKQVIGKALEGGVLRKEDEYKYEKILPTIGDVASVVADKLKGLQDAITKRRQTLLDSLGDAGYDTTKYNQRVRPSKDSSKTPAAVMSVLQGQKPGRYTLSDGSVWDVGPTGPPVKVQ